MDNIVDSEYYEPPKGGARAGILLLLGVLSFFVFLAVAIPQVQNRGGDMNTFFFVVLGGFAIAILGPLILNIILKKMHLKGKSRQEAMYQIFGYTPTMYDAQEEELGLVVFSQHPVTTGREVVPWEEEDYEDPLDDINLYQPQEENIPTLIEQDGLPLTQTFQPSLASLECQNITFVGVRRSGKSNAMAILLKQLAAKRFPIVLFDTEGEYEDLARARHFPRGWLVGDESSRYDAPEGIRFKSIDGEIAYNFGQEILTNCWQVVINLKSWSDEQAVTIMSQILLGMEDWQQCRSIAERIPSYIVVGEVTKWVPQNQGESTLSAEARKLVQNALFDVTVRRGGKRGLALIVDAQKIADVDKRILQGMWKIIFCQTEKNDLDRCKAAPLGLDPEEVQSLQVGESFVFCPQMPRGMYVRWPLSDVVLGGKSPTYANLQAHLRRITTGEVSGPQPVIPSTVMQQLEEHRHQEGQPPEIDLHHAANLYNSGYNSVRRLAQALTVTPYQASEVIIPALVEAGLIEKKSPQHILVRHP